jgi:adenosylcobinamide kinase / adenosylcobinamide-phosphate guanylyltransferase
MAAAPSLIFVTGGVRSGKSSFAEKLVLEIADVTGGQPNYLATGVPSDSEMKERIAKHQRDREVGKYGWKTIERSIQIGEIAADFNDEDIILLDCVTTLLNNELFSFERTCNKALLIKAKENILTGITDIKNRAKTLIVVSNEVLQESLLGNELVFTYGRLLGQTHQHLVKEADQAFLVEVGIPIEMKGVRR